MAKSTSKSFQAPLVRLQENNLGWVIAHVPFDVQKAWGAGGRPKVRGEINGFSFRTSLFSTQRGTHFILVNKNMQRGAKVVAGVKAKFRIELDTDIRVVTVPPQLKRIFAGEKGLGRWFGTWSYSMQKWAADWVTQPKSSDARQRRAEQVSEQMMCAMEGERELPPILQIAFHRDAQAREGWELMSDVQRRGELLAIFYYRSPEARARRVEKTVQAAAAVAEKRRERSQ